MLDGAGVDVGAAVVGVEVEVGAEVGVDGAPGDISANNAATPRWNEEFIRAEESTVKRSYLQPIFIRKPSSREEIANLSDAKNLPSVNV